MNKKFFLILRILVSGALIFVLFKLVPYQELLRIFKQSRKIYLLLGFLTFFSATLVAMLRWRFILASLEVKIPLRETFLSFYSGLFFNLFFPSFVAGDLFRGASISYRHGQLNKVASSVFMDRFTGGSALVAVALVSFLLGGSRFFQPQIFRALLLMVSAAACGFSIVFSKRVFSGLVRILKKDSSLQKKVISFHDQLYFFKENPRILVFSLAFSVPVHLLTCFAFFLNSRAFGLDIGAMYFLIIVPIIMVVALIPITIAGAGTREAAAIYFFSLIGVDKTIALSVSLLNLTALIVLGLLGGSLYITVYHRLMQKKVGD